MRRPSFSLTRTMKRGKSSLKRLRITKTELLQGNNPILCSSPSLPTHSLRQSFPASPYSHYIFLPSPSFYYSPCPSPVSFIALPFSFLILFLPSFLPSSHSHYPSPSISHFSFLPLYLYSTPFSPISFIALFHNFSLPYSSLSMNIS